MSSSIQGVYKRFPKNYNADSKYSLNLKKHECFFNVAKKKSKYQCCQK